MKLIPYSTSRAVADAAAKADCDASIHSRLLSHQGSVLWRIENFSKHYRDIESDVFGVDPGCRVRLRVRVSFTCGSMAVTYERVDGDDALVGDFRLSLENTRGEVYQDKCSRYPQMHGLEKMARPYPKFYLYYDHWRRRFRLQEDDVLVVRGSVALRGCCVQTTTKGPVFCPTIQCRFFAHAVTELTKPQNISRMDEEDSGCVRVDEPTS